MKSPVAMVADLLFILGTATQEELSNGASFGTYYSDIRHMDACGASFAAQNVSPLECESQVSLSLVQVNSKYVVAMDHNQLISYKPKYCGKRVVLIVNGKQSYPCTQHTVEV